MVSEEPQRIKGQNFGFVCAEFKWSFGRGGEDYLTISVYHIFWLNCISCVNALALVAIHFFFFFPFLELTQVLLCFVLFLTKVVFN